MRSGSFEGDAVPWGGGGGCGSRGQGTEGDPSAATPQVVEDGYEFFAKRQLVTLFSAPNYCGEFDNAGAMMSVDETLMCSFQVSQGFAREGAAHGAPLLTLHFPADSETGRQEQGQVWAIQWAEPRRPPRHPATQLCQSQEVSARRQQPQHQVAPLSIRFLFVRSCPPCHFLLYQTCPLGQDPPLGWQWRRGRRLFWGINL